MFAVWARLRFDKAMTVGLGLMVLLVAVLGAFGPVFSSALADAGLRRRIADTPLELRAMIVSGRIDTADLAGSDGLVRSELAKIPEMSDPIRFALSDAFSFPFEKIDGRRVVTAIALVDGDTSWLMLEEGRLPTAESESALHLAAADVLGLVVGDVVAVERAGVVVESSLVGVFSTVPELSAVMPQLADGSNVSGSFLTVGPLLVSEGAFFSAVDRSSVSWLSVPMRDGIDPERVPAWSNQLLGLRSRVLPLDVDSGLAMVLRETEVGIEAASTTIRAVIGIVTGLALIGLAVAALAVTDRRRTEIELVRARGSSRPQSTSDAALEGVALVAVAVAFSPFVAAAAVDLIGTTPFMGSLGSSLEPAVSLQAALVAVAFGGACVMVLASPVLGGSGGFVAARSRRNGGSTAGVFRRYGIDLLVVGLGAAGLWRLELGWDPGTGTIDPLIGIAPAVIWAAGAVLLARLIPLLLAWMERSVAKASLERSLALGWAVRSRDRSVRHAVLVASTTAIVVFVGVYGASWWRSQYDQAVLEVGAVASGPIELMDLPGASPYRDVPVVVGSSLSGVRLVAMETGEIPIGEGLVKPDLAWESIGENVPPAAALAGETIEARVSARSVGLEAVEGPIQIAALTLNGHGVIAPGAVIAVAPGVDADVTFSLEGPPPHGLVGWRILVPGVSPADPGRPGSVELQLQISGLYSGDETVGLEAVEWDVHPLGAPFLGTRVNATSESGDLTTRLAFTASGTQYGSGTDLSIDTGERPVLNALFTPELLDRSGIGIGDELLLTIGAASPAVRVVGTIEALPGSPRRELGIVMDYSDVAAAQWSQAADFSRPDRALFADPIDAEGILTADMRRQDRVSDPVSVSVLATLAVGAAAVSLVGFLGVGFGVTTSAQSRRLEFAILEALGLSRSRVRSMLRYEGMTVATMAVVIGVLLGLGLGAVTVRSLARDVVGRAVVPSPALVIPFWALLAGAVVGLGSMYLAVVRGSRFSGLESPGTVLREGEER